jgi:Holliday junction resolvase RusA-like endonuclease
VTTEIRFTVPGLPVPKGRARVTRQGFAYTPAKTRSYEAAVRAYYCQACPGVPPIPAGVPISLTVAARFPLPASAPKRQRYHLTMGGCVRMATRPDLDNIVKAVLDALNGVAWADDGQVCRLTAGKTRTAEVPQVEVSFMALEVMA